MELVDRGVTHVIGFEIQAAWEDLSLKTGRAWEALKRRVDEIPGRVSDEFADVGLYFEGGVFTRVIGVEVASMTNIPDGMTGVTVPQQRYIHQHFDGPDTEVVDSLRAMYAWAEREEVRVDPGQFSIDFGHGGDPRRGHDLYLKVAE